MDLARSRKGTKMDRRVFAAPRPVRFANRPYRDLGGWWDVSCHYGAHPHFNLKGEKESRIRG